MLGGTTLSEEEKGFSKSQWDASGCSSCCPVNLPWRHTLFPLIISAASLHRLRYFSVPHVLMLREYSSVVLQKVDFHSFLFHILSYRRDLGNLSPESDSSFNSESLLAFTFSPKITELLWSLISQTSLGITALWCLIGLRS